ncbi:hypothetical protein EON64_12370 [archaeon]|nr:MAG: hypothetical protein EON64_12370 [archaeon]
MCCRYELPLPAWVVKQLRLEEALQPVTRLLQTIMGGKRPPVLRIHNVVYSPPNSPSQVQIEPMG